MDFSCNISLLWIDHCYHSTFTIHFTKSVSILIFILLITILLLSFDSWQKFFKSRLAKAFTAGAKYYFNFIICIFVLLFAGKNWIYFNWNYSSFSRFNSGIEKTRTCWNTRLKNTTGWSTCTYETISFTKKLLYCWFRSFSLVVRKRKFFYIG